MLILLCTLLSPSAHAQHSYAEEAKARMSLDFDLDSVQAELSGKRRKVAAPSFDEAFHVPEPEPIVVPDLPLEPNSTLTEVTVFRDRALVTRERTLDLPRGTRSVVFEGLPHGIQPEGLTGLVLTGDARIVGVELVSAHSEVDEDARHTAIRDEALELTRKLGEVQDRLEALLGQRAYLRFTLLAQRGEGAPQPDLAQVRSTLDYVGTAEADIARQLREQEDRAKELAEELRPLLVKMKNPVATGRTARVDLQSDGGSLRIGLRYQVRGARWSPAYNARLLPEDRVRIEYFGVVQQDTREDWTDAALALSTANASSGAQLPELSPWYLGRDDADAISLATGAVTTVKKGEGPGASELLKSDLHAEIEGAGAVVYGIRGKRTVAGDGSRQRVALGSQTFSAVMDYTTVPKLVPEVHRRASVRYAGDVPMLPGRLSTFVGTDYLGTGHTAAVVSGEALLLSFGADERLTVSRQLLERRQEYIGAGKRTTRYHFHFRIAVANRSGERRTVELRDQLPVSEVDKVTVKAVALTEGHGSDPLAGPGIRTWSLDIEDGQERVVDLEFTVTAPTEVAQRALRSMDMLF